MTEGFRESGTGKQDDRFFSFWYSRAFSDKHTHLSVLSSCLRLFSITPSPASWSPSSSSIICSVLYHILFHLSYLFTLHLLQQSCDWRTLSTSDPISSLFIDFRTLPLSSPPPAWLPHHSAQSLPPLLFTSLFHTFCLAFKSHFYSSIWLAHCKKKKKKKVDMASQAKGLVSFLEPVTVHHSPIVITAETSSSGKFQRWWTRHYWQSPSLYLP